MSRTVALVAVFVLGALSACAAPNLTQAPAAPLVPAWDDHPRGEVWTDAALRALDTHASGLIEIVPDDVASWCPAYEEADAERRKAFWIALVSVMSGHESGWRPAVSSPNGRWHGLMQISPATAVGYGCQATSAEALRTGPANLACGLRIIAATVARDGVVAAGGGGVAADWGPFSRAKQREHMRAFTRAQPSCRS